jgi:hypothetical protein
MDRLHLISIALVLLFLSSAVPLNVTALEDISPKSDILTYPDDGFLYEENFYPFYPENLPPEFEKLVVGKTLSYEEIQRLLAWEELPEELRPELENALQYLENLPPEVRAWS